MTLRCLFVILSLFSLFFAVLFLISYVLLYFFFPVLLLYCYCYFYFHLFVVLCLYTIFLLLVLFEQISFSFNSSIVICYWRSYKHVVLCIFFFLSILSLFLIHFFSYCISLLLSLLVLLTCIHHRIAFISYFSLIIDMHVFLHSFISLLSFAISICIYDSYYIFNLFC